jgi:hypothetical protein
MTFKSEMTEHYAQKFYADMEAKKGQRFLIAVNDQHTPTMVLASSKKAENRLREHPESVVGTFQFHEDVTVDFLVEEIDYVDKFIPTKYREVVA